MFSLNDEGLIAYGRSEIMLGIGGSGTRQTDCLFKVSTVKGETELLKSTQHRGKRGVRLQLGIQEYVHIKKIELSFFLNLLIYLFLTLLGLCCSLQTAL